MFKITCMGVVKAIFAEVFFFKPKSVVRACLDFGFLEERILFGF